MKQREVLLVLDLTVILKLPTMMMMMMRIQVPLAKERYVHLLGSLL